MQDDSVQTRKFAERRLLFEQGMQKLRTYDRVNNRPGVQFVNTGPKVGRNDPCPCGSGRKYKQCCLGKSDGPFSR